MPYRLVRALQDAPLVPEQMISRLAGSGFKRARIYALRKLRRTDT